MSRAPLENIDYYDCSAKPDGNYIHPTDCTRFITCIDGKAHDFPCPDCGRDNHPQCNGDEFLVYNADHDWCDWPGETPCGSNATELDCYEDSRRVSAATT